MTHLKVAVRVRPLSRREIEEKSGVILDVENGKTIAITNIKVPEQNAGDSRERTRRFTFDRCFHQDSSQDDVFDAVENVVRNAVRRRFHSCVLAYGQSASGKTHTMMGFPRDPGLTPRLCQKVFGYLEETAVGDEMLNASVTVSYLEIYNEKVRDLLAAAEKSPLKIRQHPKRGPYVQGLTEHKASDSVTLLRLLESGNAKRKVAATLTNTHSSRSHSVFILSFENIKLTLVDLAGSERAGNRHSPSRFREGVNINKSLVALGNVISALAEENPKLSKGIRKRFIPYRDSVLTWLLKDTLGGSSDTVMIATISPSSKCYNETVNTLRFGQRAKLIVSIPVVNEDPREKTIRELRTEIGRLKELLKLSQVPPNLMPKEQNATEKIIPLMNFTNEEKPVLSRLRRTYSVDYPMKKMESARKFGSEEVLKKATARKGSIEPKAVEAKVDSIRRAPPKPRSQIIASVTHRLYAKTKKKEASTDTSDLPTFLSQRELSICSNARQQLKDLTRKAVRAQRTKSEETQTDLFPVLRMKEVYTDVDDLKSSLYEVKNAETCTEISTQDKEINCTFLDSLRNAFVVTRSCGTQSSSSVSFTKYLQEPRIELFNPNTANPIYTNSVNINISHNYLNGTRVSGSVSEDSLDDQNNVCFPTPDLISNHNSLEPSKEALQIKQASSESVNQHLEEAAELVPDPVTSCVATSSVTPKCEERISEINIPSVCASQICSTSDTFENYCQHFLPQAPETAMPNIIEYKTYSDDCIKLIEPLVLKSIMKHIPEPAPNFEEQPDSIEYHKKVRFGKAENGQNERMIKAMSEFLEEATILMNNLTMAASRIDEQEYEVQVTINGLEQKRKRKRKSLKNICCQTEEKPVKSDYIQTEDFEVPANKYELLLEDSCRRLEEKIATAEESLSYNPWDVSVQEDTSLESNPVTFSDYGSLPRRKKRSSCTPSAYLRQLASMRKQVIEASREELSNNSEGSVS